ncbi:putative addiction module toxin, RelE/StbE family [Treponema primitia ZAS-2]|uniref:Putative addiction module toxin, RelE/StbE family n=1 Tax=Treponema primitia (strain ATCC BAA-887 / DSM 12427 / ZAS-2) TaxID=545694 RepID=F5YQ30_TREPZ|nr:type II toxin-antitoxin system RelE/ParE family toxin [Treponema primitia]AEF84986.1 putative addiction module toxin, RelE/StbE family [Treponema primitia ZAS-2]
MDKKCRLRYLPLFEQDLAAARDYIAIKLQNPVAAERLVEETEKAIKERLFAPLSFKAYNSIKDRKHKYYRIYVKNYAVFYVVIDDVMEIRRFIYSKRDIDNLI